MNDDDLFILFLFGNVVYTIGFIGFIESDIRLKVIFILLMYIGLKMAVKGFLRGNKNQHRLNYES